MDPSAGREAESHSGGGLERSLGLKEALTIGVGIMIGAGIFVFPGLAGGEAGPAAMLSFAIAALVALLVALPTAELATAMPRSGGGYHFVSRGLGPLPGTLVGVGQWLGLIFASAFYLSGFGYYASELARRLGVEGGLPGAWIALVAGVALTAVAILGTRTSGRLQDWVVAGLLILLIGFLGYGTLEVTGVLGESRLPDRFAPAGVGPIFGTAALVFTSYLGFQQIAVVSGEIERPSRNLPRALLGSVVLVAALYVLTMLVVTSVATPSELSRAGETALAEVAGRLLGRPGALLVTVAGLLATLSSANASILSSSRVVFALGRDDLFPAAISRVGRRYRTPHVALLLTGLPIAGLALLGRLEILAEVASALHLVMYALVCIALLRLRRRAPLWYRPSFRLPAGRAAAVAGTVASVGLMAFMGGTALLISAGVLAAALVWHAAYARGVELPVPVGRRPVPLDRPARFLLVTPVPDPPGLPDDLAGLFEGQHVVLTGWSEVPEQASPEQAREELGDEAEAAVQRLAERVREWGVEVEPDLLFTGDLIAGLERRARDREADMVVALRPGGALRRVLVPVQRLEMADELARTTAWVVRRFDAKVELLYRARDDDGPDPAAMESRFRSAGVPVADLHTVEGDADAASAVLEAAEAVDLVILAEKGREEGMFGSLTEAVLRDAPSPVMVVRIPRLFGGAGPAG